VALTKPPVYQPIVGQLVAPRVHLIHHRCHFGFICPGVRHVYTGDHQVRRVGGELLILTDSVVYNKIPRAVDRKRTLLPSDWLEKWRKTG
jgi:hypothetical protein